MDVYEFDAPSHVIDFTSMEKDDDADTWFDQVAGNQLVTPKLEKPLSLTRKTDLPKAVVSPRVEDGGGAKVLDREPGPTNIVTSWRNAGPSRPANPTLRSGPSRPDKTLRNGPSGQPRRVSKRVEEERRRNPSRASAAVPAPPPAKKPHMRSVRLKSAEAEQRKRNQASSKAAVTGSQPARKPVLSTTVPVEFNFRTDKRLKPQDPAPGPNKAVDFGSQLRKHAAPPANCSRGATVPQPFNLSRPAKRKHTDAEAYVPMAEQVEKFQKRTPPRFHLHSRQREERGPSPVKNKQLKLTRPKTPELLKRPKNHHTAMKSSAELEEEELEKIRAVPLKAQELNRKMFEGVMMPHKPAPKEPTQTEAFRLETDRRIQERQASRQPEEPQDCTFHARPVPLHILEDVVGVPQKRVQEPTVPESPAFALKNRVRVEPKVEPEKPAPLKACPMPHTGVPFQPKLAEKSHVEMCPFSFDAREQERLALKEKRLEELRNEEVPTFKAQHLPDFSEVHLPAKKVAEPTMVEPFQLQLELCGAAKSERWDKRMKEELKQQQEAAVFKARPNTIVHKEPFLPKKDSRSIVAGSPPHLNTERRAKERLEFAQALCDKEALRVHMEEERRREEEEKEREEIARLRQEQVHKAQPIRHYRPLELKKGEVPLTVPKSPNFSDRTSCRSHF